MKQWEEKRKRRAMQARTLQPAALASVPFGFVSPTHKRTEGRAPVWGSEFTSKDAALQGGSIRNRC
jgi:hypothetical protein